jgi:hypothetical protein
MSYGTKTMKNLKIFTFIIILFIFFYPNNILAFCMGDDSLITKIYFYQNNIPLDNLQITSLVCEKNEPLKSREDLLKTYKSSSHRGCDTDDCLNAIVNYVENNFESLIDFENNCIYKPSFEDNYINSNFEYKSKCFGNKCYASEYGYRNGNITKNLNERVFFIYYNKRLKLIKIKNEHGGFYEARMSFVDKRCSGDQVYFFNSKFMNINFDNSDNFSVEIKEIGNLQKFKKEFIKDIKKNIPDNKTLFERFSTFAISFVLICSKFIPFFVILVLIGLIVWPVLVLYTIIKKNLKKK